MTFFMEVEPPVATLPLRVPAALSAAEEAVVEAEAAVLDAEEAEPPQAVRAPARHCLFVFSLGTALFSRFAALAATMYVQKVRKTLCTLPAPM